MTQAPVERRAAGDVVAAGPTLTRRAVLAAGVGVPLVAAGGGTLWWRSRHVPEPLKSEAVGITSTGNRVLIPEGSTLRLVENSRVIDEGDTTAQVAAEREWLAAGTNPGSGTRWEGLARDALLDLLTLTLPGGAQVAGWPDLWRYVWPRDLAFGVAAFAATGHTEDATAMLGFLSRVQRPDGWFEARYRPDASGPPDDRGLQLDGAGWAIWAMDRLAGHLPEAEAQALVRGHRPLLERSVAAITGSLDPRTGLPPVSPDFWEIHEDTLTLGTAAPMLAGLAVAPRLLTLVGADGDAARATATAARLQQAVEQNFGPTYPRHLDGDAVDAAVTFLSAPIGPFDAAGTGLGDVQEDAAERSARPAGGVAPGSGWKTDGVSWTPETALFALAAAGRGDTAKASERLDWLEAHRTRYGCLPEKVLFDGSPAGPAPLAWTAAVVVLALALLD